MINASTPLDEILALAHECSCSQCNHGCKMGSGILAEGDAEAIALFLKIDKKRLEKEYLEKILLLNKQLLRPKLIRKDRKPYGRCIFFRNDRCSVHPVKPLQCKVAMGCKPYGEELMIWFMLNYVFDRRDPESIRQYASYIDSGGKTLPGGALKDIVSDSKRLKKILDRDI